MFIKKFRMKLYLVGKHAMHCVSHLQRVGAQFICSHTVGSFSLVAPLASERASMSKRINIA